MGCQTVDINGSSAIICGRGKPVPRCYMCGKPSTALCDFPEGKHRNGRRKDCDTAMCDDHRKKGVTPNVDFCAYHFPIAEAAYQRRQQKEAAA